MPSFPAPVLDKLSRQYGVIDRATLQRSGFTGSAIDRRVRTGVLEQLRPGVFRLAGTPDSLEQRLAALCASIDGAIVSHTTAARLWGLRRIPDLGIHLTVPQGRTSLLDDVRVHRTRSLLDVDVVDRDDGVRVTSPPRTAFDLASVLEADALGSVIEQLVDEKKCTVGSLRAIGQRLARPGRPGSALFKAVVGNRPLGQPAVMSNWEWKLERALREIGIVGLVRQYPIRLPGIGAVKLDFAFPELRLVIEVDDHAWHGTRAAQARDRRRDRKLVALGWRVVRVTDDDLRYRFGETVADIATVVFG